MISFEVLTAKNALICTRDSLEAATAWAAENAEVFPGISVVQVTYREPLRKPVWPAVAPPVPSTPKLRSVA